MIAHTLVAGHQQQFVLTSAHPRKWDWDYPRLCYIGNLQLAELGAAHSRAIQSHQHRAVHQVLRRIDQPSNLLMAEYRRQWPLAKQAAANRKGKGKK